MKEGEKLELLVSKGVILSSKLFSGSRQNFRGKGGGPPKSFKLHNNLGDKQLELFLFFSLVDFQKSKHKTALFIIIFLSFLISMRLTRLSLIHI